MLLIYFLVMLFFILLKMQEERVGILLLIEVNIVEKVGLFFVPDIFFLITRLICIHIKVSCSLLQTLLVFWQNNHFLFYEVYCSINFKNAISDGFVFYAKSFEVIRNVDCDVLHIVSLQ